MRKAAAVMVVLSVIIILSFSSSHAACTSQPGKIIMINQTVVAGSLVLSVYILQNGTTNKFWVGSMPLTSPQVQLIGAAMAGGLSVTLQSDVTTCPASYQFVYGTTPGPIVNLGLIKSFKLQK